MLATGESSAILSEPTTPKAFKDLGHEARRPLVSLINTADLLLAGLEGELSQPVRSDIEAMRRNADEALAALDTLLAAVAPPDS